MKATQILRIPVYLLKANVYISQAIQNALEQLAYEIDRDSDPVRVPVQSVQTVRDVAQAMQDVELHLDDHAPVGGTVANILNRSVRRGE